MVINKFSGNYEFLSNFCICDITYEGLTYTSTEAAFQAAKIKFDSDGETKKARVEFTKLPPGAAKRAGRKCQLRPDWEEVKDRVMLDILRIKFSTHPELKQKLLNTKDAKLIEGTIWHDNYWGNCTCNRCSKIQGKNRLGQLLMQVRSELQ